MNRVIMLRVRRTQGWREYRVEVPEDAYVLDALQAAQQQDPNLTFRHACHHASCGSCGMRINHREKLACTTTIQDAADRKQNLIILEPMRNFPVIADLAVDPSDLMLKMEQAGRDLLRIDEAGTDFLPLDGEQAEPFSRYENCIECGLCISACPIAATHSGYLGPAPLAAAARAAEGHGKLPDGVRALVDSAHGVWRCHSAFECSAVCPSDVAPGEAIMRLRRKIISRSI